MAHATGTVDRDAVYSRAPRRLERCQGQARLARDDNPGVPTEIIQDRVKFKFWLDENARVE